MRLLVTGLFLIVSSVFWSADAQESAPKPGHAAAAGNAPVATRRSSPLGFSPATRARELEFESKALAVPTPENARKWLKTLTAEPHVAGTPADYRTALFVRDRLREWGWKADLATYEVLLNYPAKTTAPSLEIILPRAKNLTLAEAPWRVTRIRRAVRRSAPSTAMGSAGPRKGRLSM